MTDEDELLTMLEVLTRLATLEPEAYAGYEVLPSRASVRLSLAGEMSEPSMTLLEPYAARIQTRQVKHSMATLLRLYATLNVSLPHLMAGGVAHVTTEVDVAENAVVVRVARLDDLVRAHIEKHITHPALRIREGEVLTLKRDWLNSR